jgi:lipoprotein signal peptidase
LGPTTRLAIASAVVVVLDQATKTLAHAGLLRTGWVGPVANRDLALGLAGGPWSAELLLGVVLLLLVGLALGRRLLTARTGVLPAALIIGGSLGNLLDRAVGGAVRDFIVGPGMVFNVADVALLVGVLLALLPLGASRAADGACPLSPAQADEQHGRW